MRIVWFAVTANPDKARTTQQSRNLLATQGIANPLRDPRPRRQYVVPADAVLGAEGIRVIKTPIAAPKRTHTRNWFRSARVPGLDSDPQPSAPNPASRAEADSGIAVADTRCPTFSNRHLRVRVTESLPASARSSRRRTIEYRSVKNIEVRRSYRALNRRRVASLGRISASLRRSGWTTTTVSAPQQALKYRIPSEVREEALSSIQLAA